MSLRVGVDIGGTFTDVALAHDGGFTTCKVLTDYAAPEAAITRGIAQACARAGAKARSISQVIHGTTLVTNALIQRRGARTAFITTEGFRDVIEMRSENRFEQYDLNLELPAPFVPRHDRLVVKERIAASGDVLLALSEGEVQRLIDQIAGSDYEAVAISFLHSSVNPIHEQQMASALRAAIPGISVSLSSVISPQMRELPRFNTVIANAYVQPLVSDYLGRLSDRLVEADVQAPVFMLHSAGGLISIDTAMEQPVRLLDSGPAGGAIFAASFAKAHAVDQALSFDMGGTTAKICLIERGEAQSASSFEIARTYRFKKGSGMVVSTPVVEMVEIGAGGGSIASVDTLGRLQVGPASAASEPGPACYQRGGIDPTVTDANLVLGRLDAEGFEGGSIPLDGDLSTRAIKAALASQMGLTVDETAFGVTEMVDENMANAARVHTVEHGRDVEKFTMIAYGGGAPLHASRLCEKLGINRILVPPGAGVGSAIGFLRAPFSYTATRGLFQKLDHFDHASVTETVKTLQAEAHHFVASGAAGAPTTSSLTAFMRYTGQGWEIPVHLKQKVFAPEDTEVLRGAFELAYERLFGRTIEGLSIEITNWSLTVSTKVPAVALVTPAKRSVAAPILRERLIFDAATRQHVIAKEVQRSAMSKGSWVQGPAVITEDETSTILSPRFCAVMQADGTLLIERKVKH
ncbi:MAG: hydantoinase/oxoprolinase family protein [Pseudomonadota bacterium]